ncbi:MAG TPA: HNH endonuclease, partial [Methylophaga sp.]|nr:HNH endonuclease [Methylophaga sp.]
MSRKKFIESQGATCRNWTWSWSFINESEKVIIFGAWDTNTDGDTSLILSDTWEYSGKGRKQPAYEQSREHIRLIEEEGYELKTFPIIYS